MGFLDRLANWLAPSVPAPPSVTLPVAPVEPEQPPVPADLPKISAKTALEICVSSKPGADAKALLTLTQTPSQFLNALQGKHLSAEMVKVLAHGLADREGVAWAAKCAEKVAHLLPPPEVQALRAAQAWVKSPTPDKRAAAAAILKGMELKGPGTWAAQAAAWSDGGAPKPPRAAAPRMTPDAVAAAVQLSSTIAARPQYAMPQLPPVNVPTAMDLLHGRAPVVAGVVGQLQAGATVPQVIAGLAAPALGSVASVAGNVALPVGGGVAGAAAHLANPTMPGAVGALAAGAGSLAAMPGAAAAQLASTAGGIGLQSAKVSALAGASLPTMPNISHSSSLPNASMLQMQVPEIPPSVHAFMFKEQQDFIALGIEIAAGKATLI